MIDALSTTLPRMRKSSEEVLLMPVFTDEGSEVWSNVVRHVVMLRYSHLVVVMLRYIQYITRALDVCM